VAETLADLEQRLTELTDRYAEILRRWTETDQRHAHALNEVEERLREWGAIEGRLQQDSIQRLRELEHTIEHEWLALRRIQDEPVQQLRDQAAALSDLATRAFERADARFAALETDMHERLGQLSRDMQAALAELRREGGATPQLPAAAAAPFPLAGVLRIHDELREAEESGPALPVHDISPTAVEPAPTTIDALRQLPAPASALADRVDSLERAVTSGSQDARDTATLAERLRRDWRVALAVGAVLVAVAGGLGLWMLQTINARLNDAATRVAAAERQAQSASSAAARDIAAARADAERQISDARQAAAQAQLVSSILAAPDLLRFNLVGTSGGDRATAQVLWSRSRGLVFSASRLAAAAAGSNYQLWMQTANGPVSLGAFVPDEAGRAALTIDNPPALAAPVTAAIVTLESEGTHTAPTGPTVLARALPATYP
jgi:hypothetical protein